MSLLAGDEKMKMSVAFSANPRCLLKVTPARCPRAVTLVDGTRLEAGDPVVGTHLWNAHLPGERAGLASVMAQIGDSLRELAGHLQAQPDLSDAVRSTAKMGFYPEDRLPLAQQIAARLGFELVPGERPGWNRVRRAFWRNAVSWWFAALHLSGALRTRFGQIRRVEAWMSREQLLARYGA